MQLGCEDVDRALEHVAYVDRWSSRVGASKGSVPLSIRRMKFTSGPASRGARRLRSVVRGAPDASGPPLEGATQPQSRRAAPRPEHAWGMHGAGGGKTRLEAARWRGQRAVRFEPADRRMRNSASLAASSPDRTRQSHQLEAASALALPPVPTTQERAMTQFLDPTRQAHPAGCSPRSATNRTTPRCAGVPHR